MAGTYQVFLHGQDTPKEDDFWWSNCLEAEETPDGWLRFNLEGGSFGVVGPENWRKKS